MLQKINKQYLRFYYASSPWITAHFKMADFTDRETGLLSLTFDLSPAKRVGKFFESRSIYLAENVLTAVIQNAPTLNNPMYSGVIKFHKFSPAK